MTESIQPERRKRPRRKRTRRVPWYQNPKDWRFVLGQTFMVCLVVGAFLRGTVNKFDADEYRELGAIATAIFGVMRVWNSKT